MITFFTIPKPFAACTSTLQRNAIGSWTRVEPDAQVLLLGDEEGTAEAAADLGVEHVPQLGRNEHGTPLLNEAFRIARERAGNSLLCYVNTDIVLPQSLARAAMIVSARRERFLVVGECWNARIETALDPDGLDWDGLRDGAHKRGADAMDYFLFSHGVYEEIPPFAVGRMVFDNWLIWKAREMRATVVDATWVVRPLHQVHAYGHAGSLAELRAGPEAAENRRLAGGGRERLYSRFDATHRLTPRGLVPNPLALGHAGETVRRAWAKLGYTVGFRHA